MIFEGSRILRGRADTYCRSEEHIEAEFEEIDDILNSEEYPVDYPVNDTGMSIF